MKVVILAGGIGSRLGEETDVRPKPMVEIGGRPILWHIMKHFYHYGLNEFVLALGYRGEVIKNFVVNYSSSMDDLVVRPRAEPLRVPRARPDDLWTVYLIDTGELSNTGWRLKQLESELSGERFIVTYGDAVSDIDINKLTEAHDKKVSAWKGSIPGEPAGIVATVTAVRPPARFGSLQILESGIVDDFAEKQPNGWSNGGYIVCEPSIFRHPTMVEATVNTDLSSVLTGLADSGKLAAFKHHGFWQCMDTLREKRLLEQLWASGKAPWRVWE